MRSSLASASLLALAALCPAGEADLPVASVTLFSSGVGWFEHTGKVDGNASTELRFRANQINDVLKSLVLQDLDGGKVGAVGYPSQDPLDKTLKSFQVDVSGNPPLAGLLNQLRGAQVQVQYLDTSLDGTVLGCEQRTRVLPNNGGQEVVWTLNLVADGAIRPLNLADVRAVKPADPQLRAELGKALAALAAARDQDKKPVSLQFTGQGQRRVRLGYVSEAPVWKASYRLLMGKDKAHAQAWAIVENPTESDWNDVKLTLVSGRPISFVQDLYRPLYASRPEVATELQAGLKPVAYGGGMKTGEAEGKVAAQADRRVRAMKAMPAPAPAAATFGAAMEMDAMAAAAPREEAWNATSSIQVATQAAAGVGELFTYDVGKVSIPRQRSAMIPFVGSDIPLERVSIYNRAVLPRNPLAGARLTNATGLHLTPGPVTVYDDGTYAGDAQLTALPPGQTRLISFAVDQRLLVDSERERGDQRRTLAKIAKGVLQVQVVSLQGRTYAAENQGDVDKLLVIEHPRAGGGWALHETDKPIETTDAQYRFQIKVPANGKSELAVTERMQWAETVALLDGDSEQIVFFLQAQDLKPALRDALTRARVLVEAVHTAERAREEGQGQIRAITEDQERIRRNLGSVNQNTDYGKRLLQKLNEQETKLDQLRVDDERLAGDINAKRKALSDYVANLTVE
ncbi:MAG: hypothetical protein J0M02_18905 [Planctomycetes bacterium]|nr:hypothetical protein [Planctomycetota bacterium]